MSTESDDSNQEFAPTQYLPWCAALELNQIDEELFRRGHTIGASVRERMVNAFNQEAETRRQLRRKVDRQERRQYTWPGSTPEQIESGLLSAAVHGLREALHRHPAVADVYGPGYADGFTPEWVVTIEVAGQRHDVHVAVAMQAHVPPGWHKAPRYGVGDVIAIVDPSSDLLSHPRHTHWTVVDILGTPEDPRPGYELEAHDDGEHKVVGPDLRASLVEKAQRS